MGCLVLRHLRGLGLFDNQPLRNRYASVMRQIMKTQLHSNTGDSKDLLAEVSAVH